MSATQGVTVIDYGMGNLHSVSKAFEAVGARVSLTRNAREIEKAKRVVLPGVGAFRDCVKNLKDYGLWEAILKAANPDQDTRPFLGICLGLQVLFDESEEFGSEKGLGLIQGKVKKLVGKDIKIPHMGWNELIYPKKVHALFKDLGESPRFYFVHSFYVSPEDDEVVTSYVQHGKRFVASIARGAKFATQFHPEKSQKLGLQFLKNFMEWKP